jgi:hypothetical protein
MSDRILYTKLAALAKDHPELRKDLLPILRQAKIEDNDPIVMEKSPRLAPTMNQVLGKTLSRGGAGIDGLSSLLHDIMWVIVGYSFTDSEVEALTEKCARLMVAMAKEKKAELETQEDVKLLGLGAPLY